MNAQQLKDKAYEQVRARRFAAQEKVDRVFDYLLSYADFANADKEFKQATLDYTHQPTEKNKKALDSAEKRRVAAAEAHGESTTSLTPDYFCKKCGDTGFVNGVECDCLKRAKIEIAGKACGSVNKNFTFANSVETDSHNEKVIELCRRFCDSVDNKKKINLFLTGKTGAGKTYLCSAMANDLLEKGKTVLWTTAFHLNSTFLSAHTAPDADKQSLLAPFFDCDVLIIDDLGCEPIYKNVTREYLFSLLNERLISAQNTLISTNLSADNVLEIYGERISSRILDKQTAFCAELEGKDKRVQ